MPLFSPHRLPLQPFFFFNDTATTEIYTFPYTTLFRSPDDQHAERGARQGPEHGGYSGPRRADRKSTRLNSSHQIISYALFCFKKKKKATDDYAPVYGSLRPLKTSACKLRT